MMGFSEVGSGDRMLRQKWLAQRSMMKRVSSFACGSPVKSLGPTRRSAAGKFPTRLDLTGLTRPRLAMAMSFSKGSGGYEPKMGLR
jgi:hypothetical protein